MRHRNASWKIETDESVKLNRKCYDMETVMHFLQFIFSRYMLNTPPKKNQKLIDGSNKKTKQKQKRDRVFQHKCQN